MTERFDAGIPHSGPNARSARLAKAGPRVRGESAGMRVSSIAFSAYPAKDVAALLAFYRDALGLRVGRAMPSEAEAQSVEFDVGNDQWFSLLPESFLGRPAGSGAGVVFEVDDIDAALAAVRAGARSADAKAADYPHCRVAWFEDPEGNKVGLHQVTSAPS